MENEGTKLSGLISIAERSNCGRTRRELHRTITMAATPTAHLDPIALDVKLQAPSVSIKLQPSNASVPAVTAATAANTASSNKPQAAAPVAAQSKPPAPVDGASQPGRDLMEKLQNGKDGLKAGEYSTALVRRNSQATLCAHVTCALALTD